MSRTYFASDFHLGMDARLSSRDRERQIVRWLDVISKDVDALYLVGDLFDFWFEYRSVVPRGYVRLMGKLAEMVDNGVELHIFTGNHDMWMGTYFEDQLGVKVHRRQIVTTIGEKRFLIGHGDGLGPGDHGYKFIKKVFASSFSQWLYARLHPNLAFGIANFWSSKSRESAEKKDQWHGAEKEWLVQYAQEEFKKQDIDYFVFGHRHLPIDCTLRDGVSKYINLGDWLNYNSYGVFDGQHMEIRFFENADAKAMVV